MKLSGTARKQLQSALLSAFPKSSNLEQLTSFHLGVSLDSVAQGPNLSVVVFRLIEWAESQGRIEDLVNGAKAANPGNALLKQFTVSEDKHLAKVWRVPWPYLVASGIVLVFVALGVIRKSSIVEASITTSRAAFAYRGDEFDESRGDAPLLDRVHATSLDISWFHAIEIEGGELFREVRHGTWVPVNSSLPLRIRSAGDAARAMFADVWIRKFKVPQAAAINASAIVTSDVGVEFVVESAATGTKEASALTLEYTSGNQIDFTCAGCAIESAALETDRQLRDTQVLRITGIPNKQLSINGQRQRIEIELIPEANALGHEQFPIGTARFCEGGGNDPQALQSAEVTIGENRKRQLPIDQQRSTMILTPENSVLVVKGFRVLPPDGLRPAVFAFDISGRAKDIRIGRSCTETTSIMPSYLSYLFSQLGFGAF